MTALDNLVKASQDLVKDRLRLPADEAAVTGVHYILPKVLQGLEDVVKDGVYEGSNWWDGFNHILEVLGEEGGLPPGMGESLGNTEGSARVWLIGAMGNVHGLEEFFTRMLSTMDVLQAYYKEDALLANETNHGVLLKTLSRLAALTFELGPKDARLFDTPKDLPSVLLGNISSVDFNQSLGQVKPKEAKKKKAVAPIAIEERRADAYSQTEIVEVGVPIYELESRADGVQRKEVRAIKLEMGLKERERVLRQKEATLSGYQQIEEEMLAIKQTLSYLADEIAPSHDITSKPLPHLASLLADILDAAQQSKIQRMSSLASSSPSISSPVFAQSSMGFNASSPPIRFEADASVRARSCALSPSGAAQVIFGEGIDALTNIHEDFFAIASDDEEGLMTSTLTDSFRTPWLNFEGLQTTELGDVKKDHQMTIQGSRCGGCGGSLPSSKNLLRKSRLCYYTGKYFCSKCHTGKSHVLPSLVINRWDFTPQKVCNAAHWHLRKVNTSPLLRISELNSILYSKIDALGVSQRLREALIKLVNMLPKRERRALRDEPEIKDYSYTLDDADLYSMANLQSLKDDLSFIAVLKKILRMVATRAEKLSTDAAHEVLRHYNVHDMVRD